jgi:hypothetical protein
MMKIKQDQVFISYCYWLPKWDEWINQNSDRIAPRGAHVRQIFASLLSSSNIQFFVQVFLHGGELKMGQRIEVKDTFKKVRIRAAALQSLTSLRYRLSCSQWCEAEVIGERPSQIQVHYRRKIYEDPRAGLVRVQVHWVDRPSQIQLHYRQRVGARPNEWIERDSNRISPFGRHLKANMHKKMEKEMEKETEDVSEATTQSQQLVATQVSL